MTRTSDQPNVPPPTDFDLAKAYRQLEGAIEELLGLADLCSLVVQVETQPTPLVMAPGGFRVISEQSIDRMNFCCGHLEDVIRRFRKGYFAAKFPAKGAA